MLLLKQSTAANVLIGPFLDSTDGNTAETGLTISQADVRLSKNAGNMAQKNSSSSCTHDELGYYTCPLDTTDTGTLGRLKLMVHESGALAVWHEFMVVPANVYDSIVGGSDYLQIDAVQVEGSDATDQINAACDTALADYDPPTKAELDSGFAGLNDPTAAAIRTEIDSNSTQLAAIVADTNELQTDDIPTLIAALPTAAENRAEMDSNSTQLSAIVADTNELQTDDVPGLIAALNDPTAAAIADQVWEETLADHSGTGGSTAEALNAAGAAGDPWTTALPGAYGAGSAGNIIGNLNDVSTAEVNAQVDAALADYDPPTKAELDAGLAALNDLSAAEVNAEVDTALADYDPPTKAELDSGLAGLNDPTAAAIRTEIDSNSTQLAAIVADTDEIQGDLANGGRLDLLIDAILADTNELQTDDIPAAIAALNDPTAADIRAEIDSNSTQLSAIVGDTNELQGDLTDGGRLDLLIDAILADTNELQTDDIPAAIAALNDISEAEVNAQVDAAFTTQMADSVASDGSIPTREQAIYMIAQFLMERAVSGTTVTCKKVDGSTSLMTFTLDDDTAPTSITRSG